MLRRGFLSIVALLLSGCIHSHEKEEHNETYQVVVEPANLENPQNYTVFNFTHPEVQQNSLLVMAMQDAQNNSNNTGIVTLEEHHKEAPKIAGLWGDTHRIFTTNDIETHRTNMVKERYGTLTHYKNNKSNALTGYIYIKHQDKIYRSYFRKK